MISIFLLILISAIPLPEIARAAGRDGNETVKGSPMVMLRTTLKTWHSMYNSYREEINLGYCWADYFLDVKKLLSTLAGPRLLGEYPDDPSPLIAILKNWFGDGKIVEKSTPTVMTGTGTGTGTKTEIQDPGYPEYHSVEENYDNYDCSDQELSYNQGTRNPPCKWNDNSDQFAVHQDGGGRGEEEEEAPSYEVQENFNTGGREKPFQYYYPGVENFGRSISSLSDIPSVLKALVKKVVKNFDGHYQDRKSSSRALGDLFISVLGLNVPPGLGPLMLGVRGASPMVIILSRMIGTLMRVGRQTLDYIETTSFLACSKEYLLVKIFRWIDS